MPCHAWGAIKISKLFFSVLQKYIYQKQIMLESRESTVIEKLHIYTLYSSL